MQAVGRAVAVPPGARVIDAQGAIVTPGLIDADSRLGAGRGGGRGTSVEAIVDPTGDPVRAALRAADGFEPALAHAPARACGGNHERRDRADRRAAAFPG